MRRLRPEFSYAYLKDHVIAFSGTDQELFLAGLKKAGLEGD